MVGTSSDTPPEGKEGTPEAAPKEGEKPATETPAATEYADFTLPEGSVVDPESMGAFKEAAAAGKLTQEQAQAFVDLHAKAMQDAMEKTRAHSVEAWMKLPSKTRTDSLAMLLPTDPTQRAEEVAHLMPREEWQKEIKADPEFGGAKLEKETIPAIARAIKAFSPSPEAEVAVRRAFNLTSAGNHPEIVRMLARVGKSLAEGTHVSGTPTSSDGGKSAAQKLYPTQGLGNSGAQS